ncbi:MAG TPA: acylneuraminate cytidylyltransferase family protein [bacterium]|nr:acylneuraminate cytidylyltransferase family protein [bacterium]
MNIAIIPASSTSKRLPDKNILPVNGKPMISYPIEAAQKSGLFEQVIVSSKDDEISAIAKDLGCEVFPSPMSLRREKSTVKLVCQSVLEVLQTRGDLPQYFCVIFATAIFLESKDFIKSHKMLEQTDFVMGVSKFTQEPEHAMVERNGYLRPLRPEALKYKSSYFPPKFFSNGTFAWCKTVPFLAVNDFYGPRLLGYEMPVSRGWDVNTPDDYKIANLLMVTSNSNGQSA